MNAREFTPPAQPAQRPQSGTQGPQIGTQGPQIGAPCPKCGQSLSMIYRHIGGKGACPHALCEGCGYQRRLMPVQGPRHQDANTAGGRATPAGR